MPGPRPPKPGRMRTRPAGTFVCHGGPSFARLALKVATCRSRNSLKTTRWACAGPEAAAPQAAGLAAGIWTDCGAAMRKDAVREHFDQLAPDLERWKRTNWLYHANLQGELRRVVPPGQRVLEIGCATGDTLEAVEPSYGVGLDLSPRMIEIAREKYPHLHFVGGDAEDLALEGSDFDVVLLIHLLGHLGDVQAALEQVRGVCSPHTRVVIVTYNFLHELPLRAAEGLGLKMPHQFQNWVPVQLIRQLLRLADFDVIEESHSLIAPKHVPLITPALNGLARAFQPLRHLCITQLVVARPTGADRAVEDLTCTVLVPTRNERDNVAACVERIPDMGGHTEVLFVDGNSTDGTRDEIERMMAEHGGRKDIKLLLQLLPEVAEQDAAVGASQRSGKMLPQGKGHAVRLGFDAAEGDVLMILDADLTVPPEDLPRFFAAIASGKAEFANGSRLVYPMEADAMRLPNLIGNKFFSVLFSWLLDRYVGDTLRGTKALRREDYRRIAANRSHFGDFDPFGDFDLLFGAARLGLDIIDIPVHYRARTAGQSRIINRRHAPLLLRMSLTGFRRLLLPRWWSALKRCWSGPPRPVGIGPATAREDPQADQCEHEDGPRGD